MPDKSVNRRDFLRATAGTAVAANSALASLANRSSFLEGNAITQGVAGSNSARVGRVSARFNVKVPMPDGTRLSADIYRPEGPGKFPTLLSRTYFNNSPAKQGMMYAQNGYAVVFNDVRALRLRWALVSLFQ